MTEISYTALPPLTQGLLAHSFQKILDNLARSPRSDDRVLAALATIMAECAEFDRLAGAGR